MKWNTIFLERPTEYNCVATAYQIPADYISAFSGNTATITATPGESDYLGNKTHILSYTAPEAGWYAASSDNNKRIDVLGDDGSSFGPTHMNANGTYYAFADGAASESTDETITITMNKLTVPAITVGESAQSAFVSSDRHYLADFAPAVSGRYVFTVAEGANTYARFPDIYQADGSAVSLMNSDWTGNTCSAFLTAGETYTLKVYASNYNGTAAFTLTTARDIAVDEGDILSEANAYGLLRYAMDMSLSGNVTRLDLAMILASAAGLEVRSDDTELSFTDCGDLSDSEKAILKACVEAGLFSGTSNGTFNPTATMTKAEVAAAISRLSDINDATATGSDTFTDVESDAWYHDVITKLLNLQILPDTDTFSPNMVATRQDVLEWLVRACKCGYLKKDYVFAYSEGRMGEDSLSIKVGESTFLICSAYYVTGNGSFTVFNSNPDVASYNAETNSITGLSAGTTTVSVIADNGAFAKCTVRVTGNTAPPAPSGGGSSTPSTSDPVITENPDGSQTTTETAEDGTVTATTTWEDGQQAVAVKSPEGEKTITVTTATGEKVADVNIPAAPAAGKEFEDVKSGSWYESAVDTATGYGLFNGTSETKFSPDDGMTRGMLATVLYNLSGKPEYGTDAGAFNDVETGKWYEDPVDWAYKVGVTSGTSETEFSPNQDITREQLVTMLYRYAEKIGAASSNRNAITGFPDGNNVAGYAKDAMQWAVAEGFISGRAQGGKNYIAPQGTASRAEVAAVLTRFVKYLAK